MQTIIIDPDRLKDVTISYHGKKRTELLGGEAMIGQLEDSGGKLTPAFVVTVKGQHTDKHYRITVTENGALKVVRV